MGSGQPEGQQLGSQEGERGALLGCGSQEEGSPGGPVGAGLEPEARSLGTCTSGEMSISVTASPASSELADLSQGGWSDVVPCVLGCKVGGWPCGKCPAGGSVTLRSSVQRAGLGAQVLLQLCWFPCWVVREGMGAGGQGAGDNAQS